MTWAPPIKKRQYIGALRTKDGKLLYHYCAKCKMEVKGTAKGTWFERADQHDVWCFVCTDCFGVR